MKYSNTINDALKRTDKNIKADKDCNNLMINGL